MTVATAAKAVHTMIRVKDEARSVAFYKGVFGLEIADRVEFDTFILIYMKNKTTDFELELTVNKGRTEPYDLGNGYGHMAYLVEDIKAEHARIAKAGFAPKDLKHMAHDGKPFADFFFIDDPDGYKIEMVQKGGRFR